MKENSSIWVVSDVDGTLMDHSYDLSPAKETIKKLQNLGRGLGKIAYLLLYKDRGIVKKQLKLKNM